MFSGHTIFEPTLRSWHGNCLHRPIHQNQENIMKKRIGIIGLTALMAFPAFAQDAQVQKVERQGKEHRGEHEGKKFLDLPGITESQKTQLTAIFQETRKANQPRHEDMKVLREKIKVLKSSENPNQTELNGLIDKLNGVRAEMEKTRTAGEIKAMSILTKEQQEALRAKAKEHMKHKREHRSEQGKMKEPSEKM